jgi:hypothetical protein
LANYWKKRKEIFKERAFLPINLSGKGALTAADVSILQTGFTVNLPRDKKGRSILYTDLSKKRQEIITSQQVFFFFGQCLMENEISRDDGFVIIQNISNPFAADSVQANSECLKYLLASCMPIRPRIVHVLYVAPPGLSVMPLCINTSKSVVR